MKQLWDYDYQNLVDFDIVLSDSVYFLNMAGMKNDLSKKVRI